MSKPVIFKVRGPPGGWRGYSARGEKNNFHNDRMYGYFGHGFHFSRKQKGYYCRSKCAVPALWRLVHATITGHRLVRHRWGHAHLLWPRPHPLQLGSWLWRTPEEENKVVIHSVKIFFGDSFFKDESDDFSPWQPVYPWLLLNTHMMIHFIFRFRVTYTYHSSHYLRCSIQMNSPHDTPVYDSRSRLTILII